jgi:eukaryotic-like serine/threonine-protein kinase
MPERVARAFETVRSGAHCPSPRAKISGLVAARERTTYKRAAQVNPESVSSTIRSPSSSAPDVAATALAPSPASEKRAAVRLGSVPVNSSEDLRFFQSRLALFGKVIFGISIAFLVVKGSLDLLRGESRIGLLGRFAHVTATTISFVLWRLCGGKRSYDERTLPIIDAVATLGVCACFVVMAHSFVQPWGIYLGLLAVGYTTIGRAVTVPSAPGRTFLLALVPFAGLSLSAALMQLPSFVPTELGMHARTLLDTLLWSIAGMALATVASKVIYGLQEKAIEARQLGQYTLEQKIGEGGMGEIFRARHAMLRRPTAIKVMTGDGSEAALRRFEKEVQLTARLTHPNTISIYDYGRTPDGRFYYAMELLDGLTLEELVARSGPQPPARVIHVLLQVCGALREAHGVGLIHRDIKPANIYLCARGGVQDVVKVLDFGLVREFRSDGSVTGSNLDILVGTPLYLSPEAILTPAQLDSRADIYALGALAYVLLTGTPPFAGRTLVELCGHHLHSIPELPSARGIHVPDGLERVVMACLAKDPAARPQSAFEVSQRLRQCTDAGQWGEAEAERWWSELPHHPRPSHARPVAGLTLCCADVKDRLRAG